MISLGLLKEVKSKLSLLEKESMESNEIICIVCPKGCTLAWSRNNGEITVHNGCRRGREYAFREIQNPCRIVTTTVAIHNASLKRLPVRTSAPFPKKRIPELLQFLKNFRVEAPIRVGTVLVENLLGEQGINLIATRSIEDKSTSRETERQT